MVNFHNVMVMDYRLRLHLPYLIYLVENEEIVDVFMLMNVLWRSLKVIYLKKILTSSNKIITDYFESKNDAYKCQLSLALLKLHRLFVREIKT